MQAPSLRKRDAWWPETPEARRPLRLTRRLVLVAVNVEADKPAPAALVEGTYEGDTFFPAFEHLVGATFEVTEEDRRDGFRFVTYVRKT